MWKKFSLIIIGLFVLFCGLALLIAFFSRPAKGAERPHFNVSLPAHSPQKPYRVACPSGTSPLPNGQTNDQTLDQLVAFMCVDRAGNVTFLGTFTNQQGQPVTVGSGSGAPVGSCTADQIYVDTTTGTLYTCNGSLWVNASSASFSYASTQLGAIMSSTVGGGASLTQTGANVQSGTFLAGPLPVGGGNNPVFENFNVNASTTGTPTVTLAPITATSIAIYTTNNAAANHIAPDGVGWNLVANTTDGTSYWKAVSSTAPLTASTTFASTSWNASLLYVGGTSLTRQHTSTGFSTACGVGCATVSLTETAGAMELAVVEWTSASTDFNAASISDTCGNQYTPISHSYTGGGSGIGQWVLLSQFAIAGSCTLTVRVNETPSFAINIGSVLVFDITGATAYYTGTTGPYSFRGISPLDLFGATGSLGFSSLKSASGTGCTTAATSYSNCDVTLNWQPSAFTDTNYVPVCLAKDTAMQASGGDGSTGDVPSVAIRSFTASQIVVTERTDAARVITNTNITLYCLGVHP